MKIVALTGGIACGKSVVAVMLRELGAATLDTDRLSREVVAPGTPGLAVVAARFGASVLGPDSSLDRDALARLVFADPQARLDLEAIVHPLVFQAMADWIAAQSMAEAPLAVLEIPLLFEVDVPRIYDVGVAVVASRATQIARLKARSDYDDATVAGILGAQLSPAEKASRADFVIDNDGDLDATRRQVAALFEKLTEGN